MASSQSMPVSSLVNSGSRLPATNSTALVAALSATTSGVLAELKKHDFVGKGGRWLNADQMKSVLGHVPQPMERPSMLNALAFSCRCLYCTKTAPCINLLDEMNVFELRQAWTTECIAAGYDAFSTNTAATDTLVNAYQERTKTFDTVPVTITAPDGEKKKIQLCVSVWATVVASMGWGTLKKVRADVPNLLEARRQQAGGSALRSAPLRLLLSQEAGTSASEEKSISATEEFRLCQAYVRELAGTLEHNPAPGACRTMEYIAPRETWEARTKACAAHFQERGVSFCPCRKMLQKAWQSMATLVDKTMRSHSKCNFCAMICSQRATLIGKTSEGHVTQRKELNEASAEHRKLIAMERAELDDAGYRSMLYPELQATLIADGATQRNFMLPKLRQRTPKELAMKTLFCQKLYGVFLYGYGMNCYLVHESVGGGANLSCTCIYLTLLDAHKAGRPLPEELHLQLDNTVGENKCVTVFTFAGWLVQKKLVKRVRIFFLIKGHTHVVIDQAFGSITKFLRSHNVYTVQQMVKDIEEVLTRSQKYKGKKVQRLHHLFDWSSYFDKAHSGLGGFATSAFNGDGYHDFHITLNSEDKAAMKLRKYACTPEFVHEGPEGGFYIFKEGGFESLADEVPIMDIKGDSAWDRDEFSATFRQFEPYFTASVEELHRIRVAWKEAMEDTARCSSALKPTNIIKFECPQALAVRLQQPAMPTFAYNLTMPTSNPEVCTVFGGGRTKAQVTADCEVWLVKQRGSVPMPSTPTSTVSLYASDWLLVDLGDPLPALVSIAKRVQGHLPPESRAVEVWVCRYLPEGEHATFYGPYVRAKGEDASLTINRAQILVYNAGFLKVKGQKKTVRYLSEETLEALNDASPRTLPAKPAVYGTKAAPAAKEVAKRKQPARSFRRRPVGVGDSSDEEDVEDHDEDEDEDDDDDDDDDAVAIIEGVTEEEVAREEGVTREPCEGRLESDAKDSPYLPGFQLRGTRVKNDYVWVDLEGTPEMRGASPPFGLAVCVSDEAAGKVNIAWFVRASSWSGKNLSVQNSGFSRFWSKKVNENGEVVKPIEFIAVTNVICVNSIVPVRVALASESYEKVRVAPDAVRATVLYYQHATKSGKKRKR